MTEQPTDERFGALVRQRRETMGLSQQEVSDALREAGHAVSPTAFAKVEAGTRAVKISEAVALARILALHIDLLSLTVEADALEGLLAGAAAHAASAQRAADAAEGEASRATRTLAALRTLADAQTGKASWKGTKADLLEAAFGTDPERARAGLTALGLSPEVLARMEADHQQGGRTDWRGLYASLRLSRLLPNLSITREG